MGEGGAEGTGSRRRRRSSTITSRGAAAAAKAAGASADSAGRLAPVRAGTSDSQEQALAASSRRDAPVPTLARLAVVVPATAQPAAAPVVLQRIPSDHPPPAEELAETALTPHGPPADFRRKRVSTDITVSSLSGGANDEARDSLSSSDSDFAEPPAPPPPPAAPLVSALRVGGLGTSRVALRGEDEDESPDRRASSDASPPKTSRRPAPPSDAAPDVPFNATRGLPSGALADSVPWPVSYVTLFLLDGLEQDIFSLFYRVIYTLEATRRAGGTALVHCQQVCPNCGSVSATHPT